MQRCGAISAGDVGTIIVKNSWKNDPAHKLATDDLTSHMKSIYGKNIGVVSDISVSTMPDRALIIGDEKNKWVKKLIDEGALSIHDMKAGGYVIRSVSYNGKKLLVISGKGILGNVYGIFYFTERFRLDHDKSDWNIRREPEFKYRICSGSAESCLRFGGNIIYIGSDWPETFDYSDYRDGRYKVDKKYIHTINPSKATKYHLKATVEADEFVVPDSVPGENGNLPEEKWQILEYAVDKFFRTYKNVDFLGVTWARIAAVRNPPHGFKSENVNWRDNDELARFSMIFAKAAKRYGKKVIMATWDDRGTGKMGPNHWHTDVQKHEDILNKIEAKGGDLDYLIFGFKYTSGDFQRYQRYNPVVDLSKKGWKGTNWQGGGREYGGYGIIPYYQGIIFAEGQNEKLPKGGLKEMKKDGVIMVHAGGDKGGFWDRSNGYALGHLTWDVNADPQVLAREWAALQLGVEYSSPLAAVLGKALTDSPEIDLKTLYIKEHNIHSEKYGDLMVYTHRNYLIGSADGWPYSLDKAFDDLKRSDKVQAAIDEKKEAAGMVNLFLARINSLKQNAPAGKRGMLDKAYASALQYKYLVYTIRYYVSGMLAYWNGDNSKAREYLRDWKIAWDFYDNQIRGPNYNPDRNNYHPPKLAGADFGTEQKNGQHSSWGFLYRDGEDRPGSMTRDIENKVRMRGHFYPGTYPQKLLQFSKFSGNVQFEAYLGVPQNTRAGANYLVVADITNIGGFMGEGTVNIANLKANMKIDGADAGVITFTPTSVSGHDVPLLMASNWKPNNDGAVTAALEFDYNGKHYALSGSEPVPFSNCRCGSWTDQACGQGSCGSDKMLQTRTCAPSGCDSESRCISDQSCRNLNNKRSFSYEINLTKGWNLVYIPTDEDVDLSMLSRCRIIAYSLVGRNIKAVDRLISRNSYIVGVRKNCTINLTDDMLPFQQVKIKKWWNVVGFRRNVPQEEITAACGKCLILSFKNRIFRFVRSGEYLEENKAYLIRSQKNCIIT
ncbi:MAG: hypothetical protein GXO64_04120 [Candidatus Micrarchaeota archaeon]|nr:hypothetical protein [Candidatus Micrarchaeota archaeon]